MGYQRQILVISVTVLAAVFMIVIKIPVQAAPESEGKRAVIICHNEEEGEYLLRLAESCGMDAAYFLDRYYSVTVLDGADIVITASGIPSQDILKASLPAVFLDKSFRDIPGSVLTEYKNISVRLSCGEYEEAEKQEDSIRCITSTNGTKMGSVTAVGQSDSPFGVLAEDGNYYIPFYRMEGLSSILLGTVFKKLTGMDQEGKMYFMIDEVYTFSDLEKVCTLADALNEQGVPYILRIMPVYDNLEYPAFQRFTKVLRYLQSRNAAIVIHPPLVIEQQAEREPLADKMERFKNSLDQERIYYREFEDFPFQMTWEEINRIENGRKDFGSFPIDTIFGVTPEYSVDECSLIFSQMSEKWLSISDYNAGLSAYKYQYDEEIEEEFAYRHKEEAAYTSFFASSDRILLFVVGLSLMILAALLIVGRKWYRRKFYR